MWSVGNVCPGGLRLPNVTIESIDWISSGDAVKMAVVLHVSEPGVFTWLVVFGRGAALSDSGITGACVVGGVFACGDFVGIVSGLGSGSVDGFCTGLGEQPIRQNDNIITTSTLWSFTSRIKILIEMDYNTGRPDADGYPDFRPFHSLDVYLKFTSCCSDGS
jgi:hypothetical protein